MRQSFKRMKAKGNKLFGAYGNTNNKSYIIFSKRTKENNERLYEDLDYIQWTKVNNHTKSQHGENTLQWSQDCCHKY